MLVGHSSQPRLRIGSSQVMDPGDGETVSGTCRDRSLAPQWFEWRLSEIVCAVHDKERAIVTAPPSRVLRSYYGTNVDYECETLSWGQRPQFARSPLMEAIESCTTSVYDVNVSLPIISSCHVANFPSGACTAPVPWYDNLTTWTKADFEESLENFRLLILVPVEELLPLHHKESAVWLSLYLFGCSIGSSSKKRLLAYNGWLDIWEIVLLKSGDVERNPGPINMTEEELSRVSTEVLEEDSLHTAFDEVLAISSRWLTFCCCLGLRASLLDAIAKNHPCNTGDCLFNGLKNWVRKNYSIEEHGPPTWRKLVEAVDNSSGGENHALALEIAEKHKVQNDPTCVVTKLRKDNCDIDKEDLVKCHHQSATFSRMFGSITRLIGRSLKVADLKLFLRYFSNPLSPSQRYIDPSIYDGTRGKRTKDILDCLYPDYINPENTYLLEEIVRNFGSFECKKCLEEYTVEYH